MSKPTMPRMFPDPSVYRGETFSVQIGKQPNTTSFTIHKGLASFYSGYFDAALKQDTFKEGTEGVVILEEIDPVAFGSFVGWLYTHQYRDEAQPKYLSPATRLLLLADRFIIPLLSNHMVNHIRDKVVKDNTSLSKVVATIYAETHVESKLRKFTMAIMALARFEKYGKEAKIPESWPKEAVCDYATALYTYRSLLNSESDWKKRVASFDVCEFHIHAENERCTKKK